MRFKESAFLRVTIEVFPHYARLTVDNDGAWSRTLPARAVKQANNLNTMLQDWTAVLMEVESCLVRAGWPTTPTRADALDKETAQ